MNKIFFMTAVCWESRNTRHHTQAAAWCRDLGLHPLTRNIYIGRIKKTERADLLKKFSTSFTNKTEKFYLISLCKSCYGEAELYRTKREQLETTPFEIIG